MTIKVLIDAIPSANPSRCSSFAKAKNFVEDTLSKRSDVYFYWLVPNFIFGDDNEALFEAAWLPKHENIRYIPFDYSKDRMRAYRNLPDELINLISFERELWDIDLVFTMRAGVVPNMKLVMTSPRQGGQEFMKKIAIYEEMPVMEFKPTVGVSCPEIQDRETVSGYLAADAVYVFLDYEKQGILQAAKQSFQPTLVRELEKKLQITSPATKVFFEEKPPSSRYDGSRPFCLGHVSRMGAAERISDVFKLMTAHWVFNGGDQRIKCLCSTVSKASKVPPPPFVDIVHPPREEFWGILKDKMDLVLYLSPEGGFGMGFFEVLFFGTPMIIGREKWTESLIGKDYPFFVRTVEEAYYFIKQFYEDYDTQYKVFLDWQQNTLKKRFEEGGVYGVSLYTALQDLLEETSQITPIFKSKFHNRKDSLLVREVVKYVGARDEFNLLDVLNKLSHDGVLNSVDLKINNPDKLSLIWLTPWNELRQILKAFYGWEDASTQPGHLRRVKP